MSIQVRCRCGNAWQVDDDLAGKQLVCPACNEQAGAPKRPKNQPEPVSGFACPKCQSHEVGELPPNPISLDRGFICLTCGAKLRGKTVIYLVAILIALGLLAVATGVVPVFGDDRDQRIVEVVRSPFGGGWISSVFFIPLYILVLGFSVRQMLRPKARHL